MATLYTQSETNNRKTFFLIFFFLIFIISLGWFFSYILENQFILVLAVIISIFDDPIWNTALLIAFFVLALSLNSQQKKVTQD